MSQSLPGINFPAGIGGLNRTQNETLMPPEDLSWVDGITSELLVWSKEGGATPFNTAPLSTGIQSIWDFFSADFVQELVVALADNRLVTLSSSGIVKTLATLPGGGLFNWFVEGFVDTTTKALFHFDGLNAPRFYTGGASFDEISSPAADWHDTFQPHMAFLHRRRLVAMGGSNQHMLYLSSPRSHDKFNANDGDTVILQCYPGEGQRLVGGISFREKAYVAKYPRGIWFINDQSYNIQEWEILPVTNAIGLAGPGCWTALEDDVVILGADGYFYTLSSVRTFKQEEVPPLFGVEISDFLRKQINLSRLDLVRSTYYARKKQAIFCLPGTGSGTVNRKLIIDLNLPGKMRLFWSTRDECTALTTWRNANLQEPLIGDSTGTVWRLDQTTKDKAGQGYLSQFEYGSFPILEKAIQSANLVDLQVVFAPAGNWDVVYEIHRDGKLSQTLYVSQQTTGGAIGSFSLDEDVLAGQVIQNAKRRLEGDCKYVKILGRNDQPGQDFSVMDHIIRYKPGRFK